MIATDKIIPRICLGLAAAMLATAAAQPAYAQTADMSFFVTSAGIGLFARRRANSSRDG